MIRGVTYSADNMTISRKLCVESLRKHGANEVFEFENKDIDEPFYKNNKKILYTEFCEGGSRPCNGYWLQKPYFINRVMLEAWDGDYVVYCDAGVEIINDLSHIINVMDQDIFLFTNGLQHADWCKADVMQAINGKQIEHSYNQVQASALFIRVTDFSRKFIKEWLLWCQMPGMIDDSPSVIPNHPEFAAHRYDQAIICCLAYKYKLTLHWWPDKLWFINQRYRWPEDRYPPMLKHHRKRNEEW